ncbi:MAG: hypothetical protein WC433_07960 [Candidatus Omnitrophota bacterium]|jgi:hypothetical protein
MSKLIAKGIGVDSGMILISDFDYYGKDHEPIEEKFQEIFDVTPGYYKINWKIKNTWEGTVSGSGVINITSGKLVVSDPCYIIDDSKWLAFCGEVEKNKCLVNAVLLDSMGGDGVYDVEIGIKRLDLKSI